MQSEKTSDKLNFTIYDEENKRHRIQVDNAIEEGVWTHIVAVSGQSGMRFYINGELKGDDKYTGSLNVVGSNGFYFGKSNWDSDELFQGQMAELRIWNRERWPNEIMATMNQSLGGNEDGLVGYWPLGSVETGMVKNAMNNNLNLVFEGSSVIVDTIDLPVKIREIEIPHISGYDMQKERAKTVSGP